MYSLHFSKMHFTVVMYLSVDNGHTDDVSLYVIDFVAYSIRIEKQQSRLYSRTGICKNSVCKRCVTEGRHGWFC